MLEDQILVLPIDGLETGPVISTRQYEDKPCWGIVLKVGRGRLLENGMIAAPCIDEGDVVCYGEYATTKVRSMGVDYFFVLADDIKSKYTGSGG